MESRDTRRARAEHPPYSSLLELDVLLSLQLPDPWPERPTDTDLEKHFFILIHQAFELWFRQIIRDVDAAAADLSQGAAGWEAALRKLRRTVAIARLLEQQMRLIRNLD